MNVASFLGKLKGNKSSSSTLSLVLLEDAIYLTFDGEASLFPIDASGWLTALTSALDNDAYTGANAIVTLGAHHYQSYQVEKPELPPEEWAVGLPFLLKDLVAERVTEIVADGVLLPNSNKLQTYVLSQKVLTPLRALFDKHRIDLQRVVPEDEVWAQTLDGVTDFVLLHQSTRSSFKINAYVESKNFFHRTIRGVMAPVTGVNANSLQVDGLALELQRSIDYLSSQVKQSQFHKIFICCDDEIDSELKQALEERLSVKVDTLHDKDSACGVLLSLHALHIGSSGINLFPDHLRPRKEYFSLPVVVGGWLAIAVLMGGIYGYIEYNNTQQQENIRIAKQQADQFNHQLKELQKLVSQHQASPVKLATIERLEISVQAKQESLKAVGQFEEQQQIGYSGVMSALARLGRSDISLNSILIQPNTLNVSGLARNPSVIPNWIKQFKNELDLVGRSFEKLSIGRNEDDIVTFDLQTKRDGGQ